MRVELRSGDLRATFDCGGDVFYVGCRLSDPNRSSRKNIINLNFADNIDEYKMIFEGVDVRMSELCLGNDICLQLCCFVTDDPSILAMMKPYAGLKIEEVVYGDTELTITV